jgi:hypothetical protein
MMRKVIGTAPGTGSRRFRIAEFEADGVGWESGSLWTRCWREMDSNLRFPNRSAPVFETATVPSPPRFAALHRLMQRRSCHFLAARPIASLGPPPTDLSFSGNPLGCLRRIWRRSGRLGSARFCNNHGATAGSIGCSALLSSRGP